MKRMRKILDSKLFWLIVSFLVSFSVWVYVTSVETVESTKIFRNIQVELVGEETLEEMRGMVVTDLDTPTVTVEIRGQRRVVNALDSSDLTAQVDVSKLSQSAYTSLSYTIVYPSGTDRRSLSIVSRSPDSVNFMVSRLTSITVPVQGGFEGRAASGFIQETPVFDPATVTVTGPEVYLRNIDHAYVTFGKDMTLESTYSAETGYVLADADNNPVATEYLSSSPEVIQATLPILSVKEVPLIVAIEEGAGATEGNARRTYDPATIRLAGDSAVLAEINQIQLDVVDLCKFEKNYTATYAIPIPNGVRNLSGVSKATVTIDLVGLEVKEFQVSNFQWTGFDEEKYEVVVESESVPVLLRGPNGLILNLNEEDIVATADLTELANQPGSYIVTLKISVPGQERIGQIQVDGLPDYTVAIRLKEKD